MDNDLQLIINDQGVATIVINRPESHNAFDDIIIKNMLKILQQLNLNSKVKVIQITSEGKIFSSGADINWMRRTLMYSLDENIKDATALSDLMWTLKFLGKPTIAKIQGAVFGGGVGIIACCDIAVASSVATFCLSEVKIGLIPSVISPYVIAVMGERAARRYMLTAETIAALDAKDIGLIQEVVAPENLDHAVETITKKLLSNGPQAIKAAKALINRVAKNPYDHKNIQKNIEAIAAIRVSQEAQEGLAAFLEKRKAVFFQ